MRWSLPSGSAGAATARRALLLLACLLLDAAAFVLRTPPAKTATGAADGGAVRAFLERGQSPQGQPQQQQQPQPRRGAVRPVCAHGRGAVESSSAAAPVLMRRGYTRRRHRPGARGGKQRGQQQEEGAGSTALQALLTPEFDIVHVAGDVVAGFVGGAVGVVGTMVALEVKMRQVNERSKCPYCSGSGQLTCARCFGQQTVSYRTADGQIEQHPCPSCLGAGTVTCINCKGDGLAIPVMLDKKVSRDPETRLEEYGMG